jgi:putative PIN family toxin of toxin-antitoxin system
MRVVLDTNVLLSALISPSGTPSRVVDAWFSGQFTLVSHTLQLEELRDTSRRESIRVLISAAAAGLLVNEIRGYAEMPTKLPRVQRSRDVDDDFLLALCEAGRADWLVTGDKDGLLSLRTHGAARIATVAEFAQALGLD